MKEKEFKMWMLDKKNANTIRTYIARCFRVEKALSIDLDVEYKNDCGEKVIQMLEYSREDERNSVIPKCGVTFSENANIYAGMHSLRASVKKYFDYLTEVEQQEKE